MYGSKGRRKKNEKKAEIPVLGQKDYETLRKTVQRYLQFFIISRKITD